MEASGALSEVSMVECAIVDCPFREAPVVVCQQFEAFCNGVCEAINPEYEFSYDQMMSKGDQTCHWTIRKKGELVKEKKEEIATPVDPVKMLTTMYIKGEITEEEFRKKMTVLKEFKL